MQDKAHQDCYRISKTNFWTKPLDFLKERRLSKMTCIRSGQSLQGYRWIQELKIKFHKEIAQNPVYSLPNRPANAKHMEKDTKCWTHTSVEHMHRRNNKHHCIASSNKLCRTVMQQVINGQSAWELMGHITHYTARGAEANAVPKANVFAPRGKTSNNLMDRRKQNAIIQCL